MNVRRPLVATVAVALGLRGFTVLIGCDSTSPAPDEPSQDASVDAALPDDAGATDTGTVDASTDRDEPPQEDAGGHCSTIEGPCDIVLQNCPVDGEGRPQECVTAGPAHARTTACIPVQATQQLPKGRACCPPTDENPVNTCLPGLTCVGRPCEDGGPPTGRCSPACCAGDDPSCGTSDPEGVSGSCDLSLVDENGEPLHMVCSYRERCKPFGVEPCKASHTCLVEDENGMASCVTSFGKTEGQPCTFSNECGDGLYCLQRASEDAGVCRVMCVTPNAILPFDAGPSPETAGPGKGGCASPQGCNIGGFKGLPPWLSFCRLPDGG